VLARPARGREEIVEPVRVGARIGKGQNDAAPTIVEGAHHAPLDQRRIERRFELREELLALGFRKLCCGHTSPPLAGCLWPSPKNESATEGASCNRVNNWVCRAYAVLVVLT